MATDFGIIMRNKILFDDLKKDFDDAINSFDVERAKSLKAELDNFRAQLVEMTLEFLEGQK